MRMNPVFREGIQVYLIEGHGFVAYFYLLIVLAPLEFLILFLPSFDPQNWMGPANLFKVSSVAVLVLILYFGLRVANQEFVPWRFLPLRRWLHQEGVSISEVALAQIALLCLHVLIFALLSSPLLIWAGAIARATPGSILSTFFLLLFYSLTYGVWGLVGVALWEHRVESRQVFVRCLFVSLLFLSGLLYLPLNPVAYLLYYLGGKDMAPLVLWGWRWSPPAVHFLFHICLLASGLLIYWRALKKKEDDH
ncbi:MAG: hypothetical protein ACE5JO_00190 [Candidatus Binatia bacterium]